MVTVLNTVVRAQVGPLQRQTGFPVDEYHALEETAEILCDEETLEAIEQGLRDIDHRETVTLCELRTEIADRRTR